MSVTFDENQKKGIRKLADVRAAKAFRNFMNNMKDLLDPAKNTIMNQVLAGREPAPETIKELPPRSDNEDYTSITPEDLIARVKYLADAVDGYAPDAEAEFDSEAERDRAYAPVMYLQLLKKTAEVFNDKYSAFTSDPDLEAKVYAGEVSLETYRAFKMGKSIIDEISKIDLDMDAEKKHDDEITAQRQALDEAENTYRTNQKKLRAELDLIDSSNDASYKIGNYQVGGELRENVFILKEDLKKDPRYYADQDTPLDAIMAELDKSIEEEKQSWLDEIRFQYDQFVELADRTEREFYRKSEETNQAYSAYQKRYDDLTKELGRDLKFSDYKEYNDLQQAIDDAVNTSVDGVEDKYQRNFEPKNRSLWESDFDRESAADYTEDLAEIDRQIAELEETAEKEETWIESAGEALKSAKETADLGNHVDTVLQEKAEQVGRQIAELSELTQNNSRPRITKISDIPQGAFSVPGLLNKRGIAEEQYLKYLGAQRGFTHTLKNKTNFRKILSDLNAISDAYDKLEPFPDRDSVTMGLNSGIVDELKKAVSENDPKDPEKTGAIRLFGEISQILTGYETQLNEAAGYRDTLYSKRISDIDLQTADRAKLIEENRKKIADLKASAEKLEKETRQAILKNRATRTGTERLLKETLEENLRQEEEDYKKALEDFRKNKKAYKQQGIGEKNLRGSYDFAVQRAKAAYARDLENLPAAIAEEEKRLNDLLKADLAKNAAEQQRIGKEIEALAGENRQAAEERKKTEKERSDTARTFDALHETVKKYKEGEYSKLSQDVDDSLNSIVAYLDTVSDIYAANDKLRSDDIELLKAIPGLEQQVTDAAKEQPREQSISRETLEKLARDIDSAKEQHRIHKASLEYLKKMKAGLEKGRAWSEKKKKLKKPGAKAEYETAAKKLQERDRKLQELKAGRDAEMARLEQFREKKTAEAGQKYDEKRAELTEQKKTVQSAIDAAKHAKRTLESLKTGAVNIIAAKNRVNESVRQEQEILQTHFETQHRNYDDAENRLMDAVMGSKKKYGFTSGLFGKVKDEITAYRQAKEQLGRMGERPALSPDEAEAYKLRTKKLADALDDYISKRFDPKDPAKKTKEGQVRLDAVMELRNCIRRHENDLAAYRDSMEAPNLRKAEVDIPPQTGLEREYLKMGDPLQGEQLSAPAEEIPAVDPLTEEEKQRFAEEDQEADRAEENLEEKQRVEAALNKMDEAEALKQQVFDRYFKADEAKKTVIIPKIETQGRPFEDLQAVLKVVPDDLRDVVLEYDRVMSQVPADYGFERFNKDRWFFDKYTPEQYKQQYLAFGMFMKDYHIVNPIPNEKDLRRILEFDRKVNESVIADALGYREYFNAALDQDHLKDPMNEKEFLTEKFGLKDEQAYRAFILKERRRIGKEMGLTDPRTEIRNYGSFIDGSSYLEAEIQKKLDEAKKASALRDTIIKEIDAFDQKMASVNPDYGFKAYIKTKDILPYDEYVKSGAGSLRYALEHKLENPEEKYRDYQGEWTPEMLKELADYERTMEKNRAYGYKQAYNEMEAQERKQYEESGAAKEAYLTDHPRMLDPRVKYAADILRDGILTQMYRPELLMDNSSEYHDMSQLIEDDPDYEKHMLEIIGRDRRYKEAAESADANPLAGRQNFKGDYYQGFEKYPEDLKDKIREYDMIMATVPEDYGYASFESKVDFCHRFSREAYIANGLGRKYFCRLHQMLDPRAGVSAELAEKIRRYDLEVGVTDAKAHKAWEKYTKEHQGEKLSFEAYKQKVYGEERLMADAQQVRDAYDIQNGTRDPRKDIPNYGRIVLNKADYDQVKKPLFDDSERLQRNAKIVAEMKTYIKEIRKAPADYGFEEFKPGQNIEEYVTRREYKMTGEPVRKYAIDNHLENPIDTYWNYIKIDSDLKRQINKATGDYRADIEKRNKQYAEEKETDPLAAKRDEERARTKGMLDDLKKTLKKQDDEVYAQNRAQVNARRQFRTARDRMADRPGLKNQAAEYTQIIEKKNELIRDLHTKNRESLSKENVDLYIGEIYTKRYCERLTLDDIEREDQALYRFEELLNGQETVFGTKTVVPISDSEKQAYMLRSERLHELKQLKARLDEMEKTKPELVKAIRKDPKRQNEILESIRSGNKEQAKKAEKQRAAEKVKTDSNPVLE